MNKWMLFIHIMCISGIINNIRSQTPIDQLVQCQTTSDCRNVCGSNSVCQCGTDNKNCYCSQCDSQTKKTKTPPQRKKKRRYSPLLIGTFSEEDGIWWQNSKNNTERKKSTK